MPKLSGIPLVRFFRILCHILKPEFGESGLRSVPEKNGTYHWTHSTSQIHISPDPVKLFTKVEISDTPMGRAHSVMCRYNDCYLALTLSINKWNLITKNVRSLKLSAKCQQVVSKVRPLENKSIPLRASSMSCNPSMEIFHPLRRTPPHADAPSSAHGCAKYQCMTVLNLRTRNWAEFIGSALAKYFVNLLWASWAVLLTFFNKLFQFCWPLLPVCLIFLTC